MSTFNDIRTKFANAVLEASVNQIPVIVGNTQIGFIDKNDQEIMDALSSLVNSAGSKNEIVSFLLGIGFPANEAETLFNQLSKKNDVKIIASYFKNRTITIDSLIGKISNAGDINKNLGLEQKSSEDFYGFSWRTSPPMGPGEVWLSTILRDGRRPTGAEKGDVIVGSIELEVKGPNGRLIGQSGYGDAKQLRIKFNETISRIADNLGHTNTFKVIDTGKDNFWNVGKKSGEGFEINLKELSKTNNGFSPKEISMISTEIITAFKNYLLNLDIAKYSNILSNAIGKDGSINTKKWHEEMLPMFFEYYHNIELFEYIAFTSGNGRFLLIDPINFRDSFNKGLIDFTAAPSFTNGAGSQGGTYGISIK
jgi:hypothetical protein